MPARPWVGAAADDLAARVFGRALGARDLALGLGALAALQGPAAGTAPARAWVAAGALSDALDVVASLLAWRELPRVTRWLVAVSAAGAALAGAAERWPQAPWPPSPVTLQPGSGRPPAHGRPASTVMTAPGCSR